MRQFNLFVAYLMILKYVVLTYEYGTAGNIIVSYVKVKVKQFPLQAWSGSEGYRKLRFPDYMTTTHTHTHTHTGWW